MPKPRSERYRLEHKLGSGSFGDVWLATDTLLGRQVAVKRPRTADVQGRREEFLAEARLLARLNHPNITQIYDAGFEAREDRFYLVLEYGGEDLDQILASGPLSLEAILIVARGILDALAYLHGQDVVHRDLKPANVLIGERCKLTDFGFAEFKAILQRGTDRIVGAPAYMAPEQVEGRAVDGRADLYALGVLLYEMLTGGLFPFDCTDPAEMLGAHLHLPPTPLSDLAPTVPPALEQVVMRLLAKDPEERYPSAEAVKEALDAVRAGPRRGQLPVWLTPFVGREGELAAIGERLQDPDCRLLTLVGPGGIGKTRLAVEAARAHEDDFADGICFVSLAALQSVDAILPSVADAMGLRSRARDDARRKLLDHLGQKNLLLVLDNLEHLLDGSGTTRRRAADVATDILQAAPAVKILATSRAKLRVQGEHLFPVAGMAYPPPVPALRQAPESTRALLEYSAVQLFTTGARRVQPDLALTDKEWGVVAEICHLVEGMPLAIEIAAAWSLLLRPSEIASEIRQSLDLLETDLHSIAADGSAVSERHRSIRAVFDHSWSLLTERERQIFRGLTVFRGSFAIEAARQVVGASLPELMSLVNKSFLYRVSGGRLQIHALLWRYGAGKLDSSPDAGEALRDRHCAYYADILEEWGIRSLDTPSVGLAVERGAERENARAAWDWALERGYVDLLDRSLLGLCRCYQYSRAQQQEGEAVCKLAAERLSSMISGGTPLRAPRCVGQVLANTLAWQAMFSLKLGRTERARQLLRQSAAALREAEQAGQEIQVERMGVLLRLQRALDDARDAGQPAAFLLPDLDRFRTVNDTYGHYTGDIVVAGVWRVIRTTIGESGILGRWATEEFTCLLPGRGEREAAKIADAIRRKVQNTLFSSTDGREVRVTVSVGIAVYPRDAGDLVALYDAAERAAGLAKRLGWNRVCLHSGSTSQAREESPLR